MASQHLLGVNVVAQPGAVIFNFKSAEPTVPMITIWRSPNNVNADMIPQNQVTVSFGPNTTDHSVRVEGLPQASHLIYKVSVGDPAHSPMPVEEVDFVNTLSRTCLIDIVSIKFLTTGFSDNGARVDLNLAMYDGAGRLGEKLMITGSQFASHLAWQNNSVDNGQVFDHPFGGLLRIENAPDRIVPWVIMAQSDGFDILGTLEPSSLPDGIASGRSGGAHSATAMVHLDLPRSVGEAPWRPFVMETGPTTASFSITGREQTIVTDPLPSIPVSIHFHPGRFG